jgi:Phage Tail Collar Domain
MLLPRRTKMLEHCPMNARSNQSAPQRLDRRGALLGAVTFILSVPLARAGTNAPKLIILPKGITSPVQFTERSPKDPSKIASLTNISLEGFLVCNGAAVSRTDYKELFDVLGTRYGAGDGVSTFDLPNYPVQYRSGSPVMGSAMCPSSRLGLPVGVVVPFDVNQ